MSPGEGGAPQPDLRQSAAWGQLQAHYEGIEGARAQRLLWASTGTKDPEASDTLYIEAFASPFTVDTMPDKTLEAFADHGEVKDLMDPTGGSSEQVLKQYEAAGIDLAALAQRLQDEGKDSFDKSWEELLKTIADKRGVTAG